MKVGVVVERIPPQAGGTVTFAQSVIGALREAEGGSRHEFTYYSAGGTDEPGFIELPAPPTGPPRGAERLAQAVRSRSRSGSGGSELDRSLRERGIELVWFADRHAEECSAPYIFTVFDIEHLRQPWFPEISVDGSWEGRQAFFSRYIPRATRVIVPGEVGRQQVLRNFPVDSDRLMALPHPTSEFALEAASQEAPPREALAARGIGDPFLFYPAQFWPHKNHLTALLALAQLNAVGDGFDLVLAGSDKHGHRSFVEEKAAELGVAGRVHFLGFVELDELIALYRHAHALVYLALFGPENLPPLEAMALGCPVIAADVPGAAEQLGDAALRVQGTDPEAVAAAVRTLSDARARSQLIEAGRARAGSWRASDYVAAVIEFLDEFEPVRRLWQ